VDTLIVFGDSMADIRNIRITETALRDAHQSLLATRMRTEDMLPILEEMDRAGYWSIEAWGGATFDTCLRFLKEDPWERLRQLKAGLKKTPIQMLLRGQNILGYRHYPDDVLRKFIDRAAHNGVGVFRIFDAMNDLRNVRVAIEHTVRIGAHAQGAISYTTSPVHTSALFVEQAQRLAEMGCQSLVIKDMAGLLDPDTAFHLVSEIKRKVALPLHLHSHATSGMASMTMLKGIEAGLDGLDTAISPLAEGTSHPTTEAMVAAINGTPGISTGIKLDSLSPIADHFRQVRKRYKRFESAFNGVDPRVLINQIPGGMISNLANQLREQGALDRMDEVLAQIPVVREDFGYPPLVTPTSQIVGTQAVLNVLTGEEYKVITTETKNYLKGLYGKPQGIIDEEVRKKAIGDEGVVTCRPADLLEPEMDKLTRELGDRARSTEDVLSYALFPQIALEYFEERASGHFRPEPLEEPQKSATTSTGAPILAPTEFNVSLHGETFHVVVAGVGHKENDLRPYFIRIDDALEEVLVEPLVEVLPSQGGEVDTKKRKGGASRRPRPSHDGDVGATMPGTVVAVKVTVGDSVKAGDAVLVIEAMKMESEIHAAVDGKVEEIFVEVGDAINPDETLIQIR